MLFAYMSMRKTHVIDLSHAEHSGKSTSATARRNTRIVLLSVGALSASRKEVCPEMGHTSFRLAGVSKGGDSPPLAHDFA